ncbi:MAG: LysE family transporter [Candidatus Promineifilaceae bacterium]|nr:LysE family transporter [Candidatus Promineifilaceae bacterium]
MLSYFIQGLLLGIPAVATPGPLQAVLLNLALRRGWRRTLPAALAPLLSDGPIILLVLLLLARVPPTLLDVLRIAGGIFLLALAYNTIRSLDHLSRQPTRVPASGLRSLLQATVTNLLNPNPYLFWSLIAGPLLIEAWRQAPSAGFSFLLGFYGTIIVGLALLIVLFARLSSLHQRARLVLGYVAVLALILFGLYLLWSGVTSILLTGPSL